MNNKILKICKHHGELHENQVFLKDNKYYKCKQCQNKWTKNFINKDNKKYCSNPIYKMNKKISTLKSNLKVRNGISLNQYNDMFSIQNGLCKICKKPESRINHKTGKIIRLSVDHCHRTIKIRGLLCDKCNRGLGHFDDSIEILQSAIKYLIDNF